MQISNKCYYALKALYELAIHYQRSHPVKIALVASRQKIPKRFLEVILNELRQGGFVESRRGVDGGYYLARKPDLITIGEVVRFVDGDISPVACVSSNDGQAVCEKKDQCPFYDFWLEVKEVTELVYDGTTLSDIMERWNVRRAELNLNYEI
ncbi:MAG TPA: Rrf2 family transcriptional regulator [archaeon]|nr:Rrf2 family transcriptional regulator [archaeon]